MENITPNGEKDTTLLDAALQYYRAGFTPIPNRAGTKAAFTKEWQHTTYADEAEVEAAFSDDQLNIGILLSDDLTEVDIEAPVASTLLEHFGLPSSGMQFRRGGRTISRLYRVSEDVAAFQTHDAVIRAQNKGKSKDEREREGIIEIRAGGQRLVGPSIHPDGSRYETVGLEPSGAEADALVRSARQIAAAVQIGRYWPGGDREDAALALSGGLLRAGFSVEWIEHFMAGVCLVADDEETPKRIATVEDTAQKQVAGEPTTGWPRLAELLSLDYGQEIVSNVCAILAIVRGNDAVGIADFYAYLPEHKYLYLPTRIPWPAASVNGTIPPINGVKASVWLDRHQAVQSMTWAPGEAAFIEGRLPDAGGWIERAGTTTFNLYRPPTIAAGDPHKAQPWVAHVQGVYPDDWEHIICWLAHRVQRPGEKINHALVLGGAPGIGKDTLLEPVKRAVGPWNVAEIAPSHLLGRFNSYLKSVILRISEARDLGDFNRYTFYEHMKTLAAAPPDMLRVDEKNIREYDVPNVCGVVITTNYKLGGMYLPADDRRHYVAWSEARAEDFAEDYWNQIYGWYENGGDAHVAAYLATFDISNFDPKAPPPKTAAFHAIVDANRSPEVSEVSDVLEKLEWPRIVTLRRLMETSRADWLHGPNRRLIPHRLAEVGYERMPNPDAQDGRWKIGGAYETIYGHQDYPLAERLRAVEELRTAARLVGG